MDRHTSASVTFETDALDGASSRCSFKRVDGEWVRQGDPNAEGHMTDLVVPRALTGTGHVKVRFTDDHSSDPDPVEITMPAEVAPLRETRIEL